MMLYVMLCCYICTRALDHVHIVAHCVDTHPSLMRRGYAFCMHLKRNSFQMNRIRVVVANDVHRASISMLYYVVEHSTDTILKKTNNQPLWYGTNQPDNC